MKHIDLILENDKKVSVKEGTTFKEVTDKFYNDDKIILCDLSGYAFELGDRIPFSGEIKLILANSRIGWKIYSRTLQFIFIKAALDVFPEAKIEIEHSISKGTFGEIKKDSPLSEEDISKIKKEMVSLINRNLEIKKLSVTKEKAISIFNDYKMWEKIKLLSQVDFKKVDLYELDGRYDYFYGQMAYSTGIIKAFDLFKYAHGFVLQNPTEEDINVLAPFIEKKSLANIFYETNQWNNIIGVGDVGSLNEKIDNGELRNIVLVSEALHEKKIANIADSIKNRDNTKIVLIAGPSSSGKTTFAERLGIQLRVNGLIPLKISLDDYFVDRENTPKDENGDLDFEALEAIDVKLFNKDLKELLDGNTIEIPVYNFRTGKREWIGNYLKIPKNGIVIIEGIHGLNPNLTKEIDNKLKYKIYISALTQLNIDKHNRISTTDVRKVRRIVRDYLSRGYGAEETLKMWPSIKRGERKNIFVYENEADVMFNSTLVYELCVLKKYALRELDKIKAGSEVYNEAERLKSFLSFFREIDFESVLENSILREFIGGSCFY